MTRLEQIKKRSEAATPGPWQTRFIHRMMCAGRDAPENCLIYNTDPKQDWPDAEFIAHAREDVPWLIKENERLHDLLLNAMKQIYGNDEFDKSPMWAEMVLGEE